MRQRVLYDLNQVVGVLYTCPACSRRLCLERTDEGQFVRPETLCPCTGGEHPVKRKKDWEGFFDHVVAVLNPDADHEGFNVQVMIESK